MYKLNKIFLYYFKTILLSEDFLNSINLITLIFNKETLIQNREISDLEEQEYVSIFHLRLKIKF